MNSNSIKKNRWLIVVGAFATAALACGSLGGGADSGSVAGVTEGTRITVTNSGPDDVCYVYVSPSSDDAWGDDQLGSATVPAGGSHGFAVEANVSYDIRADDCSDRNISEQFEVSVAQDQNFTWPVAAGQAGAAQVTLINNGSTPVCFVNFSLSSEDSWGPDRLATESVIDSGGSITFQIASTGEYDFRAMDCDRNTLNELFSEQINSGDDLTWEVGS